MANTRVTPTGIRSTHVEQIQWRVTYTDQLGGFEDLFLRAGAFPEDYLRQRGTERPFQADIIRPKA